MGNDLKNNYDDLTVYYANELARKYCKFTLEEQKVLHLIFSQINPYGKNPITFKLNKLDFFNKLELESKNRYPRYRKLVHSLINKSLFEITDEKGGVRIGVVIFDSYWKPKEAYFEISLNPNFMPYLEQLVREYTKLQLDSILKLKSKHSLTLYKFLCSWTDENKKINQRYITTKDLKELLGLSIDDYVYKGKFNRADFERKTINLSLSEINEKTDLIIKLIKNYKNGKVQNYEFTWTQKDKTNNSRQYWW
ncbi:replication initiation protein [Spiroplasma endosymbiont of Danaus chrysippus]|uniref:replication initiation protein n=1 Tax=Spiroplasma endosymbiont of Danaus chrysippus TaxID=2691041 RepID=UPI00157BB38F|nr:replication initiation protein [Spiroplasma endosymbiont of Danaus chrysippus]